MVWKWGKDDGVDVGFEDDMELGTNYDTQLGIIHVLELVALMTLLKTLKTNQIWAKMMPLMNASKMYFSSLTRNAGIVDDDIIVVFNTMLDLF